MGNVHGVCVCVCVCGLYCTAGNDGGEESSERTIARWMDRYICCLVGDRRSCLCLLVLTKRSHPRLAIVVTILPRFRFITAIFSDCVAMHLINLIIPYNIE